MAIIKNSGQYNPEYGSINQDVRVLNYTGLDTDTADITIDDENRTIKVDVKKNLGNDYLDLDNKPQINSVELKGNVSSSQLGVYSKPSTGIPKSDLSSAVKTSLSKADTAVQEAPIDGYTYGRLNGEWYMLTRDHNNMNNLSFENSGHTGFASENQLNNHKNDSVIHTTSSEKESWDNKYNKPETGIPKSDFDTSVQASLDKADSALQEHQSLSDYRKSADQDLIDACKQEVISDLETIRQNALVGSTAYHLPESGIPKTDLSTDVQGSLNKADTALQEHQSLSEYRKYADQDVIDSRKASKSVVDEIVVKIPDAATSENKLTDKEFVNSSIATNTAHYISNEGQPFTSVEQLKAYSGTVTNNDYAFVTGTDEVGNTYYDRYKATVTTSNSVTWAKEYRLNNSSFTATQWAAIQSGINSSLVADLQENTAQRHSHTNKSTLDNINEEKVSNWDTVSNKVDKVEGKQLSTNDYDNTEKENNTLNTSNRHNHTNKELLDSYNQTNSDITDAVSKKHSHSNLESLNKLTDDKMDSWTNKQDSISDLQVIREGATKGATSIQPEDIATPSKLGIVKPDGTSIQIDEQGTLSANAMPTATLNGTAAIYHDGEWNTETGYGYRNSQEGTYIDWDGIETGRDSVVIGEYPYYRISDSIIQIDELTCGAIYGTINENSFTIKLINSGSSKNILTLTELAALMGAEVKSGDGSKVWGVFDTSKIGLFGCVVAEVAQSVTIGDDEGLITIEIPNAGIYMLGTSASGDWVQSIQYGCHSIIWDGNTEGKIPLEFGNFKWYKVSEDYFKSISSVNSYIATMHYSSSEETTDATHKITDGGTLKDLLPQMGATLVSGDGTKTFVFGEGSVFVSSTSQQIVFTKSDTTYTFDIEEGTYFVKIVTDDYTEYINDFEYIVPDNYNTISTNLLPIASSSKLGLVQPDGTSIQVSDTGIISANAMPSSTVDGSAAIYYNGKWNTETGYGYGSSSTTNWDGNISGKTAVLGYYWRVDDITVSPENYVGGTYTVSTGEETYDPVTITQVYQSSEVSDIWYILPETVNVAYPLIYFITKQVTIEEETIESGIYFYRRVLLDNGKPAVYPIKLVSNSTVVKMDSKYIPAATLTSIGGVKPDGTTVTISEDGTISANGIPSASINGSATIYYNNSWNATSGYGYQTEEVGKIITWDGVTEGREGIEIILGNCYKVSDLTPTKEELENQYYIYYNDSNNANKITTVITLTDYISQQGGTIISGDGTKLSIIARIEDSSTTIIGLVATLAQEIVISVGTEISFTVPSTGTYLGKANDGSYQKTIIYGNCITWDGDKTDKKPLFDVNTTTSNYYKISSVVISNLDQIDQIIGEMVYLSKLNASNSSIRILECQTLKDYIENHGGTIVSGDATKCFVFCYNESMFAISSSIEQEIVVNSEDTTTTVNIDAGVYFLLIDGVRYLSALSYHIAGEHVRIDNKYIPIATSATTGAVKPDGSTITITSDGTISSNSVIPDTPTEDGTYTLKCTVTSGTPTYQWVKEE